jgi:hypothetical protein
VRELLRCVRAYPSVAPRRERRYPRLVSDTSNSASSFVASLTRASEILEGEADIELWSASPITVRCAVSGAGDPPSAETEQLLAHIERSLPRLWPAIQAMLLDVAHATEAWKLLARLDDLTVSVDEGSPRWTLSATFTGKRAGTSFFVDVEKDVVVGGGAAD